MQKYKILFLALIIVFLPAFGFRGCHSDQVRVGIQPIELKYWRVWDETEDFAQIITAYQSIHPNIRINYRKLRYSEYEQALIEAFATDRGPDIFSLHNTWMKKYHNLGLIEPMPEMISMVHLVTKGSIKKETVPELRTSRGMTIKELTDNFIDVVYGDAAIKSFDEKGNIMNERIYGLPLAVDSLVMFYNKDLFNNAGIANPPQYWNREFQQNVKKLTKQDTKGRIIQSGVALGGSTNIERYSDILSALMMQNGTEMLNESGTVTFNTVPVAMKEQGYNPGIEALRFYTDFANPAKEVYAWNNALENSLDMFIRGQLAIFFGYSYHLPIIKDGAPKLNFSIMPLPQIEGNTSVNFANYWLETVSKKIMTDPDNLAQGRDYAQQKRDAAWDFIRFAADANNVGSYLESTKKSTALRSLIDGQKEDDEIAVFADQLLTAKSWYRGIDANAAEMIIGEMIDEVISGQGNAEDAINRAAQKVQQTIRPPKEN